MKVELTIEEIYKRYCDGNKSLLAMSYNISSKQYELKPILNAWQQRNDPTIELLIEENGKEYKIECSADHKIMTRNRGYVEAASLTSDDDIMIFSGTGKLISIKINKEIKPLYDIEVEDNHNFVVNDGIVIKNSEQYLSKDSCCVLSSINAGKFSTDNENLTKELEKIGYSINRFLDNVNEMELRDSTYVTPHQKLAIQKLRRTGAGITNIAAWLFKINLEYGSKNGNDAIETFADLYNYYLYKSSIELGREKGSFGLFNQEKYEKSPFIKRMIKKGLIFDTMRNVTCSSIAPTGCSVKSTKIKTSDGIKSFEEIFALNNLDINNLEEKMWFEPIKDISVQDCNGNLQKITKLYYNGMDVTKTLCFDDGDEFSATLDHKILIKDNNNPEYGMWKSLNEISENDEIIFLE